MRKVATLLGAAAAVLALAATASAADFTAGSASAGDPFFPNAGNGGYEVLSVPRDLRRLTLRKTP